MKLFFITIFLIISLHSFSQSGFLGSKYNVIVQSNSVPLIFGFKGKMIKGNTAYQYGNRNLNLSYTLGINRVISDDVQIGIAYKITPLQIFNNGLSFQSTKGRIATNMYHQSIVFNFRKIIEGISPIGKQWGLNFEFGRSDVTEREYLVGEIENEEKIGLINQRWDIKPNTLETVQFSSPTPYVANTFILKYYRGRTIPLHKKIALDFSLTVSLLRVFHVNNKLFTGFQLFNSDFGLNELGIEILEEVSIKTYNSKSNPLAFSILKYNDFSLNIGLRYFL